MVLLLFWALMVLFTIGKPFAFTSSIPSLSNTSNERLSIPVRVFCRSPVPGPIPSIVDCVPSITQMALGPGAFLPQTYRRGSERHWDGYSGQGYCKIAMSGGAGTVAYSDDELLEYVLWMVGRCFPPGNGKQVSEALALLGHDGSWRLQFTIRMATEAELQMGRNRSSILSRGDRGDDVDSVM
ncbi:MAG: hypothetical protein LQ349_009040 [Xanthoria aureola]|nr:MAG: hypothetical protein LQ349_009040 [Xanthoria aureola]